MKRLFALLCVLALAVSLMACAKNDSAEDTATNPIEDMTLSDILDGILKDVPDLPGYQATELTSENFEFYAFVPYEEGYEGLAADAMIGSIAHSVVLVRVPEDADAAAVAKDMEDNADPRKWICVEAEATHVRQYGDTILLVMSSAETANAILVNFDALNGVETPSSDLAPVPEDEDIEQVEITDDILNQPTASDDGVMPEDNMPTLDGSDANDNMPVLDPGDEAVEMPTAKPEQPDGMTMAPVTPPATNTQKPSTDTQKPVEQPATEPEQPTQSGTDLTATMNSILSGVADLPMYQVTELTSDNFEFFTFIPYADGYKGVQADSLIGSIAHSVVLVEVPAGTDASTVAADMKANADPRKWICVEAESVQTAVKGQLVLLVMSTQAHADAIVANFNAL